MKIFIASDHAGFGMKGELVPFLLGLGADLYDCGPEFYEHDDDYPDYISIVAKNVSQNTESSGIILGLSGQGEAMVANRFPQVRCALYYGGPKEILTLSREHNNANILSLGTKFLTVDEAKKAVDIWFAAKFSGEERHVRRIKKIEQYDTK